MKLPTFAARRSRRRAAVFTSESSDFCYDFRLVRPAKLEFFDHPFTCPLCKADIVYTSMQTVIVYSRRLCPACKGELEIQQGKIITATADRKPPKRASVASAKRSRR